MVADVSVTHVIRDSYPLPDVSVFEERHKQHSSGAMTFPKKGSNEAVSKIDGIV